MTIAASFYSVLIRVKKNNFWIISYIKYLFIILNTLNKLTLQCHFGPTLEPEPFYWRCVGEEYKILNTTNHITFFAFLLPQNPTSGKIKLTTLVEALHVTSTIMNSVFLTDVLWWKKYFLGEKCPAKTAEIGQESWKSSPPNRRDSF